MKIYLQLAITHIKFPLLKKLKIQFDFQVKIYSYIYNTDGKLGFINFAINYPSKNGSEIKIDSFYLGGQKKN